IDRRRRRIELAILLVVVTIDGSVERALVEILREGDLVAAGKRRIADERARCRSEPDRSNQPDVFHDFPLVFTDNPSNTRHREASFNPGGSEFVAQAMAQTKTPPFAAGSSREE